jgi:hypothetical protein
MSGLKKGPEHVWEGINEGTHDIWTNENAGKQETAGKRTKKKDR